MWAQNYDPMSAAWLSTLLAAAPVIVLLGLLASGISAVRAAIAGLVTAFAVAVFVFRMPWSMASAAAGMGACVGLLPIGWIVLTAIFLYQLTVESGQFEIVKRSISSLSPDHRMQALLIAFSFGAFVEGVAGFGTPVAISAALLCGLGFSPLHAAGLALIANTSPVAFGALGTPIVMLSKVSGISEMTLSQMAGRQLPFMSLIVPAWLVATMSGWRGLIGAWPAVAVCGGSFAVIQFLISNFHGPTLVDVVGGLGSLACLAIFLRFWQPKKVWRFDSEDGTHNESQSASLTRREIVHAWGPWIILSLVIFVWGLKTFKDFAGPPTTVKFSVPGLHQRIVRTPPVAKPVDGVVMPEEAVYDFAWLAATGTGIFLASTFAAFWLRIDPKTFVRIFLQSVYRVRWALVTIVCMLALAYTTKYSGADATMGLAFTKTGSFYPFFAPLLGWLGVALTGSDTSSNALFGSLQRITAEQLNLNTTLIVASNSTGGVMGKMIDAQSIVVAAVATHQHGQESAILRYVFFHSVALAILMGLLTYAQAYWLVWMIPDGR